MAVHVVTNTAFVLLKSPSSCQPKVTCTFVGSPVRWEICQICFPCVHDNNLQPNVIVDADLPPRAVLLSLC